jgi:LCP family protein required for cell wall assembly
MTKINHALAVGGIPFQQLVVERYLGVEIDHYGLVDFAALTQVVDELGGITVDNPEAFAVGDQQFAAGTIELDGAQALLYSRYRGGADGDFGRVEKQQQVIKAIMDEVTNANLVRLVPDMFGLLANHIRTDFGITDSLDLANTYRDTCTSVTLETHTIPGDVGMHFDDMMQMDLSFVVSDPVEVRKEVEWLLGVED